MPKNYSLGILIGVIISIVGMGIYVYALPPENNDVVICDSPNLQCFERNFTVNGLSNPQKFEINVTEEGITTEHYLPVGMSILSNDNENDIVLGRPYIDAERRDIFVVPISNMNAMAKNVTLMIIIFGA